MLLLHTKSVYFPFVLFLKNADMTEQQHWDFSQFIRLCKDKVAKHLIFDNSFRIEMLHD